MAIHKLIHLVNGESVFFAGYTQPDLLPSWRQQVGYGEDLSFMMKDRKVLMFEAYREYKNSFVRKVKLSADPAKAVRFEPAYPVSSWRKQSEMISLGQYVLS